MGKKKSSCKGQILFFASSSPYSLRNCLFECYEQRQRQIFKNLTFGPHLAPKEESISSLYGIYDSSLGNILTLSPPSPKRGKSLRMSLGILTIHKKRPTCKKSALWLNLQSIWNGVPPRHTHGENRYSKSTGLIGLIIHF